MQWTRSDLKDAVPEGVRSYRGKASIRQVAKYIWDNHARDLQGSPAILYTWQYDMRWAATKLRHEGVFKPADKCEKGIWELA